jgi:pimeloyl-ACP methyl ester carboxylesterase
MRRPPLIAALLFLVVGTAAPTETWTEQEVTFPSGAMRLQGILTLPGGAGPFPAIVLVSGSVDATTGLRDGASSPIHVEHARRLVRDGYAVLRYDPPGVGRSSGTSGYDSLDSRVEEAMAALRYLSSHRSIENRRIGLLANSQGAWVIQMAAARYPGDVSFIITLSGAGVSVAEQQVYGIEMQSRAGGLSEEDVRRAVTFGRLLIDWQLTSSLFEDVNRAEVARLGGGPLARFMQLVYAKGNVSPAEGLATGLALLREVTNEPWAKYLYLAMVVSQMERIPVDQIAIVRKEAEASLRTDPKEFLVNVRCPVLAFFGAADTLQPTERSAALYREYLDRAGNTDYTIVVFPGTGHSIEGYWLSYWDTISAWLAHLEPHVSSK